jgi:DNA-binding transcriptional LysR family regulator
VANSFAKSAAKIGVPQSAPSHTIRGLEERLGALAAARRAAAGQRGSSRSVVGRTSERTIACA